MSSVPVGDSQFSIIKSEPRYSGDSLLRGAVEISRRPSVIAPEQILSIFQVICARISALSSMAKFGL